MAKVRTYFIWLHNISCRSKGDISNLSAKFKDSILKYCSQQLCWQMISTADNSLLYGTLTLSNEPKNAFLGSRVFKLIVLRKFGNTIDGRISTFYERDAVPPKIRNRKKFRTRAEIKLWIWSSVLPSNIHGKIRQDHLQSITEFWFCTCL